MGLRPIILHILIRNWDVGVSRVASVSKLKISYASSSCSTLCHNFRYAKSHLSAFVMIITIVFISASDVMLASTTAYFLLKTRRLVLPQYPPYCFSTDFTQSIFQHYRCDQFPNPTHLPDRYAGSDMVNFSFSSMAWTLIYIVSLVRHLTWYSPTFQVPTTRAYPAPSYRPSPRYMQSV